MKGLVTRNINVQHESLVSSGFKVMAKVKVFSKVGQTSRSRSKGKNKLVPFGRSCHREYTYAI